MMHHSTVTPCPVYTSLDQLLDTNVDEDTANLEFTTALRASFKAVKPRRRPGQSVQFAIHEDNVEDASSRATSSSRATLLKPPRRAPTTRKDSDLDRSASQNRPVSEIQDQSSQDVHHISTQRHQGPRRSTLRMSVLPENAATEFTLPISLASKDRKPVRRKTLYIPNEDTTMPSVYMGIFSPIKSLDLRQSNSDVSTPQAEMTGIAAQMAIKRGMRKSLIGATPRRGILQSAVRVTQVTAIVEDQHGQGGGKENVPPGLLTEGKKINSPTARIIHTQPKRADLIRPKTSSNERSGVYGPTTASLLKRESPKPVSARDSQSRPAWGGSVKSTLPQVNSIAVKNPEVVPRAPQSGGKQKPQVPTRFILPVVRHESVLQKYPVLEEDVVNPELYEEQWLQHQEVAMTQLVNNLFSASSHECDLDVVKLRHRLMKLYDSSPTLLMRKRLQAALLYGSLSIPQEALEQSARLQTDLGLKKRFTDLWLATYDLATLGLALEVLIGRECMSDTSCGATIASSSPRPSRSRICAFLEAFLIRNEDGKPGSTTKSRAAWSIQRTVLRSLILIKLLDLTKSDRSINMTHCLFQHSSPFKTSVAVVQALMQMLNPAAGDPLRALGHVGYNVIHTQHSLEEFNYKIENLALDLRDGIRLVRLVELLLYPSSSSVLEKEYDAGTTTVFLPEGEMLEFEQDSDWPLSQHLKPSPQSRAVRLWNVQLGLSALQNVKGVGVLIDGITADDIVDGFREKTIGLLWALVGKWGLTGLIDWHDLRWEIQRLERKTCISGFDSCDDEDSDVKHMTFEASKQLLRRWARAVASSHGVRIQNFTTSFADGKAFEAFVNEYEPYLHPDDAGLHVERKLPLQQRLVRLGCSTQFAQLFVGSETTQVFDRDFVLAALAFFCSRLLAPSRQTRAAVIIQQAWRRHWSSIENVRKKEKSEIALACVALANSKRADQLGHDALSGSETTETQVSTASFLDSVQGTMSPASSDGDVWLTL